jgi:hypothetical protein
MGPQPECCARNLHRGGHGDPEGHSCGPKGLGPKAPRNSMLDAQQPPRFWAPNDIVRYTIKVLFDITA